MSTLTGRYLLRQVLSSTMESRSNLYFELFDLDGSGSLDKSEIMHMLLSVSERSNRHAAQVLDMLAGLDTDCDGLVSFDEFLARATRQPLLLETLERMFMVCGDVKDVLAPATRDRTNSRFRGDAMRATLAGARATAPSSRSMLASTKRRVARERHRRSRESPMSVDSPASTSRCGKRTLSPLHRPTEREPVSFLTVGSPDGSTDLAGFSFGRARTISSPTRSCSRNSGSSRRRASSGSCGHRRASSRRRRRTSIDGGAAQLSSLHDAPPLPMA